MIYTLWLIFLGTLGMLIYFAFKYFTDSSLCVLTYVLYVLGECGNILL